MCVGVMLTSIRLNLKRRRPHDMMQQEIRTSKLEKVMQSELCAGYDSQNSTLEPQGPLPCIADDCHDRSTTCPISSASNGSHGRLSQYKATCNHAILTSFTVLVLISLSTSRFVTGELQHHYVHRDENLDDPSRNTLNRLWEEGGQQGNSKILNYSQGGDELSLYSRNQEHGGYITKKGRELLGEKLEDFIRNQDIVEEFVPPAFRSDISNEEFNVSYPPNETDVSSSLSTMQSSLDYGDSIKKGNPLIRSMLPINFEVELLVKDTLTNELLKGLEVTFENYIQNEYQKLIDNGGIEKKNTDGVKLGEVDLTLSLVESKWWEGRNLRRLNWDSAPSMRGSSGMRRRELEEDTKLMTFSVDGAVNYSMEVDGSVPTPDEIEEQWSEAYVEITSQEQLQRAIEDADIEGVIRLEQVTTRESNNQSNIDLPSDTAKVAGDSASGSNIDGGDTDNDNVASLYKDDAGEKNEKSSGVNESGNELKSSKKGSQLERPSTLSIVFGFILTGIAILGLVGYAVLFYRKRKKHLKKKRKMKESITFSTANAAIATAAATAPKRNPQYYSKNTQQLASQPAKAQYPTQMHLSPMMLSESVSEETSYKGLESSIGSEDISDPFANELKLAASLDQEAWNESQRKRENLEKLELARAAFIDPMVHTNRNSSNRASVPSLLSNEKISRDEEDEIDAVEIEAGLEESDSWVKSFPYGDEAQTSRDDNKTEAYRSSSSNQWEPYNSVLPPLLEEKKDETSASEIFAQKLKNIEKDLSASGGQTVDPPHTKARDLNATDDSASTSDILSEVSELSRYVRRYEKRKDRKIKREEILHQRRSVGETTTPYISSPQTMSIGMDGRVLKARNSNNNHMPTSSVNTLRRLQPNPLSSYAESFRDAQKHETSIQESLSFVSDDEDDAEETSMRSQRLGISPYRRSTDEVYFENGSLRHKDNTPSERTRTSSSRSKSTQPEDDSGYPVGHSHDNNKASSFRLADLRANDAIIDNSNSEVNVNYNVSSMSAGVTSTNNTNPFLAANNGSGIARLNIRRADKSANAEAIVSAANQQQKEKVRAPKNNKRFDKLRGLFEQKTNEQPEPIYPPGEHWQYAGSLGK